MENRQYIAQLLSERGFLSVSAVAREFSISIDDSQLFLSELLGSSSVSGIYSVYDSGKIKLIKSPTEASVLFAVSLCENTKNSFQIEYAYQRNAMRSNELVYPPSRIGPLVQNIREFRKSGSEYADINQVVKRDIPILKEASIINQPKTNFLKEAGQAQIFFKKVERTPEAAKNPEKILQNPIPVAKVQENKEIIDYKSEISPIKAERPHKKKTKGLNEILASSIYTFEEDDRMDIEPERQNALPLKRKLDADEKGIKKTRFVQPSIQPTPMPSGPRFKHIKETSTKTYMDEKGRFVTEEVIEDKMVLVTEEEQVAKPLQVIGLKKGTQSCMQSFLVKSA